MRRLLALGTFDDLKRHPLTFLEALEPLHFNGGKMREKLFTALVGRNEPKALDVVKPLDNSLCHIFPLCLFHFVRVFASALGLEQAAATNPTAILLDPVDYDGSADIIKEIQDRDIPVILFDAPTPEGSGLTSVGNDFAEQATIAVDMLVEKMGTKGKVAVMQGAPTAPNHAERYQAHLDALAKYPDIQVIDGGIDNDNVETAQSQAAAVLAANPDLTGYLNCDACGSGVAAAIEEKGMQDKVTFVAMDNLIEILDYVKTGTITATSSTLPQEQGMYAVLMAYQAAQGMPLPANVDTGIGRITADNIDEWIETVSAK